MGHEAYRLGKGRFLDALYYSDCRRIVLAKSTFSQLIDLIESQDSRDLLLPDLIGKLDPFFETELLERRLNTISEEDTQAKKARQDNTAGPTLPHRPASFGGSTLQGTPEEPKVMRNCKGKRVDPHVAIPGYILGEMKSRKPRLCNNYHLRGACLYGNSCGYQHGQLSGPEIIVLSEIAKEQACRNGSACSDPGCFAGHRCTLCNRWKKSCRFSKDMHFKDTTIVKDGKI